MDAYFVVPDGIGQLSVGMAIEVVGIRGAFCATCRKTRRAVARDCDVAMSCYFCCGFELYQSRAAYRRMLGRPRRWFEVPANLPLMITHIDPVTRTVTYATAAEL